MDHLLVLIDRYIGTNGGQFYSLFLSDEWNQVKNYTILHIQRTAQEMHTHKPCSEYKLSSKTNWIYVYTYNMYCTVPYATLQYQIRNNIQHPVFFLDDWSNTEIVALPY